MSDYTYTDSAGRTLEVTPEMRPSGAPVAYLAANDPGVIIPAEDAPAVALAILEAAGCADLPSYRFEAHAVENLRRHQKERAEALARENEDAKVFEFYKAQGIFIQSVDELYRFRYRAARDFFQGEKPHNHVFGDEPDGACPACNTGADDGTDYHAEES